MSTYTPFLLTILAASTTIIGGLVSVLFKKDNQNILSLSLSFSAGVMIYLSFVEILPKGVQNITSSGHSQIIALLSFFLGLATIIIIDKLTPRLSHTSNGEPVSIEKIGIISMVMITLHNFPEGMAVYSVATESVNVSLPLVIAIALHNLPEGIVIAAPIYFATGNRKKALVYASLSALAEPIGGLLGYSLFKSIFQDITLGIVFSFVAGIMIFLIKRERKPTHHLCGWAELTHSI